MAKIKIKVTDPPVKEIYRAKTPADQTADTRDALSYLAGRGLTGLVDDDARGQYSLLVNQLGREKAQALANSVFLHNQRPGVSSLSPEARIQSYYSTNSSHPDVKETLQKVNSFGQGVIPGFRGSSLLGNMIMAGREAALNGKNTENNAAKNVKLLVKNLQK